MTTGQLKGQLVIKGWVVTTLVLGFVVSVTIPKLAIIKLGEVEYGLYALIVGFAGVLAFSDLGLIPGLTRGLAEPLAKGARTQVEGTLKRIDRLALRVLVFLATGCVALMYWSLPAFGGNALHAWGVFALATLFAIKAEIRSALLRVSGHVATSYALRSIYLLLNLLAIVILYLSVETWSGVWLVCYGQLVASLFYYLATKLLLSRTLSVSVQSEGDHERSGEESVFWSEAWRISSPERINRVVQLAVGVIERPLLVATGGLALVSSYDLLMRLMLFVSAVPGALGQPLLAMLMHDAVRDPSARRFSLALTLTKAVGAACALVGLMVAIVLWTHFHQTLFGVVSRIPPNIGLLVAVVTAINVLTAPGAAAMMARGVVWPCNAKMHVEAVGVVIGGILAWTLADGLLFIVIRYCSLGLSAVGFLLADWHLSRSKGPSAN